MLSLSLLFVVRRSSGSFATAGAASGALSISALTMPLKARLIDRWRRRTLAVLAVASGLALMGIVILAGAGVRGMWTYVLLATAAGLSIPPLGPVTRAWWAANTTSASERQLAYSLDLAIEDTLFLLGPLAAGFITQECGPAVALGVTAALLTAGSIGVDALQAPSATEGTGAGRTVGHRRQARVRRPTRLITLLCAVAGISLGVSAAEVAVASYATSHHHPAVAGYVLASMAAGSLLGGLTSTRVLRISPRTALVACPLLGGIGLLAASAAPNTIVLALSFAATGAAQAPSLAAAYVTAHGLLHDHGATEISAWVNTAFNCGAGLGAAFGGLVLQHARPDLLLIAASCPTALASLPATIMRRRTAPEGRDLDD